MIGTAIARHCWCSLAILLLINGHTWAESHRPQPSLTDVVLLGSFPLSSLSPTAGDHQACVERYLIAARPYLSGEVQTNRQDRIITIRRWRLERHIVVIHGPIARRDAEQFAAGIPLRLEWEGMSEGPLMEAHFTEQWLMRYPHTPIVPFLYLLAAHRFRAGFEASSREHAKDLILTAAEKYRHHLQKARGSGNDKILCIADDMDALPYVYLSGFGRP